MAIQETPAERVARVRAEIAAKRNGAAAPAAAPAQIQTSPIPAVAQASVAAPATPPAAPAPVALQMPNVPGMTEAVWNLLGEDTKKQILASLPAAAPATPPPAAVPAAPAQPAPTFKQQTAPINPPDMLTGGTIPAPPPAPAVAETLAEAPKRGRGRPRNTPSAAENMQAAAVGARGLESGDLAKVVELLERIASQNDTIGGLLEIIATK